MTHLEEIQVISPFGLQTNPAVSGTGKSEEYFSEFRKPMMKTVFQAISKWRTLDQSLPLDSSLSELSEKDLHQNCQTTDIDFGLFTGVEAIFPSEFS